MKYKRRKSTRHTSAERSKNDASKRKIRRAKIFAVFLALFYIVRSGIGERVSALYAEPALSGKLEAALRYGESNISSAVSSAEKLGMYLKGFCFGFLKGDSAEGEKAAEANDSNKANIPDNESEIHTDSEPQAESDGSELLQNTAAEAAGMSFKAAGEMIDGTDKPFTLIMPCTGYISSSFGLRVHPITGKTTMHNGVDIAASSGSKIICASDGVVERSEYNGGSGNFVLINHGNGYTTSYSHMQGLMLTVGQSIKAGEQVGCVGSTGMTTGPHLHFELKINGSVVNPMDYVSNI